MSKWFLAPLGGLPWKGPDGEWRTNGLDGPGDQHGLTLDRFRVVATAMLCSLHPHHVLALGDPPDPPEVERAMPSGAEIVLKELVELGVAEERIIPVEAKKTLGQLEALSRIIDRYSVERVDLISNEWHLGRIRAMIACSSRLHALRSIEWHALAAEEVMLHFDFLRWRDDIIRARTDPRTAERIRLEQRGQIAVFAGLYA